MTPRQTASPAATPRPQRGCSRRAVAVICVALAALVRAVFSQTFRHEFVNYDDAYVYENRVVTDGLTLQDHVTEGERGTREGIWSAAA